MRWKIKFLPLTDEGKEALFRKYFQPQGRLANGVKAALREIRIRGQSYKLMI